MKASAESIESNRVKLSVEVDEKEMNAAVDAAFKKIATQVNIPGFRAGKAPRRLIEARVGTEAARNQALNDSLPDFYSQALAETDTDAIAAPEIDIVSGQESGPVVFEATVEVRPTPSIAGYDGLQVTVRNPQPSDEDIDAQIQRMREQSGELESVERAAKEGDFATIDLAATDNGQPVPGLNTTDYSYKVGSGMQALGKDFDEKVAGSSVGDVLEFTSQVPSTNAEDEITVDFRVEVKAINELVLPELNDEWANEVSEFETLDELREDIAQRLRSVRAQQASQNLRGATIEAISELVQDELPEALIDTEMQRQLREITYRLQQQGMQLQQFLDMTGQNQDAFVGQLREAAVSSVRADLALRALAKERNIDASDEEVEDEIKLLAGQLGQKPNQLRKTLERAEQLPAIRSDICKSKALEWLMDNVEVVDADGNQVDRSLLKSDDSEEEASDDSNES